jgi:adenosylcobinamide-GDP ribazoletransferase
MVAQTVPATPAAALTLVVALSAVAVDHSPWPVLAVAGALTAAHLFRRHLTRRLGGITGDVLGSLTELATTVALVLLALLSRN